MTNNQNSAFYLFSFLKFQNTIISERNIPLKRKYDSSFPILKHEDNITTCN